MLLICCSTYIAKKLIHLSYALYQQINVSKRIMLTRLDPDHPNPDLQKNLLD
jgi:hypothetical protein